MSEATEEKIKIAWIPHIEEWRDVFECEHGLHYCLDPGDGLGTHIEDGDGIKVIETTEADCDKAMADFEATLSATTEKGEEAQL